MYYIYIKNEYKNMIDSEIPNFKSFLWWNIEQTKFNETQETIKKSHSVLKLLYTDKNTLEKLSLRVLVKQFIDSVNKIAGYEILTPDKVECSTFIPNSLIQTAGFEIGNSIQ